MSTEMQDLKQKIAVVFMDALKRLVRSHDQKGIQRFQANFYHFADMNRAATEDVSRISNVRARLSETMSLDKSEDSLIGVFIYLLEAEGVVCNWLDFAAYLLVMTEHDLYSLTKRRYVKEDIEEIRKVEMSTKIQFLRHHDFGALVREYDSTFRNDIAHHNYKINENGELWVRGKKTDLDMKTKRLNKIIRFSKETIRQIIESIPDVHA